MNLSRWAEFQPKRPLRFDYEDVQRKAFNKLSAWCAVASLVFVAILVIA